MRTLQVCLIKNKKKMALSSVKIKMLLEDIFRQMKYTSSWKQRKG